MTSYDREKHKGFSSNIDGKPTTVDGPREHWSGPAGPLGAIARTHPNRQTRRSIDAVER
jgi:hypothetical protein